MITNNAKTGVLLAGLTALLMVVGAALGGRAGMMLMLLLTAIMNLSAFWYSDRAVLRMYGARPLPPSHPVSLAVAALAQRAGVPQPQCYLIDTDAPNAFATGRDPAHASIAVTQGLYDLLSVDELQGVLAHELAHVVHRDTLIGVVSATLAGAISSIANWMMWPLLFNRHRSDEDHALHPVAALCLMVLAPMAASLIQMAVSRQREFEADRGGALLSQQPIALANALLKIASMARQHPFSVAEHHPATAHLFIINPLMNERLQQLFATHPPTAERVARLQKM